MSDLTSVLVVGGGMAGLAAACDLADAGVRVTLIEKRPFLGGRAYSYQDKASGLEVDNGQHVFLGCCTEYIAFLKRLGVYENVHLQKRLCVRVIDKLWGESTLRSSDFPPPLHLLPSLIRMRSLSPFEKALAALAFSQVRSTNRADNPGLDGITFDQWLKARRQSPRAIRSLWNLIIQPTLNDHIGRVSADLGLMVMQEGFLRSRHGANVGWAKVGLTSLVGGAVRKYIEKRGGEVRLGAELDSLSIGEGGVVRATVGGSELLAENYVLAVPAPQLLALLPLTLRASPFFVRITRIQSSPIINVHLWYDREVWDGDFAAFLNTPVQWVFNKSRLWRQDGRGQYLDISLSGARDLIDLPSADILELFTKEMAALLPAARGRT